MRITAHLRPFLALTAALCLSGCGGVGYPTGTLTGKAMYNGEPMKEGTVLAVSVDGLHGADAQITDGTYTIDRCPQGEVKLGVVPPAFGRPKRPGDKKIDMHDKVPAEVVEKIGKEGFKWEEEKLTEKQQELKKRYGDFPDAYRNPQQSGLKTKIGSGTNNYDLVLSPGTKKTP